MKHAVLAFGFAFLLAASSFPASAGLTEDANGVLHCSGKSSCDSLKTACKNGHATYESKSPSSGTCTVGATAQIGLTAKNSATKTRAIKLQAQRRMKSK